ncbi:MAG: hypothetical protein ACLSUW_10275 [Akkermansia sp.]
MEALHTLRRTRATHGPMLLFEGNTPPWSVTGEVPVDVTRMLGGHHYAGT